MSSQLCERIPVADATEGERAVFDRSSLLGRTMDDEATAKAIAAAFVADIPAQLDSLERALGCDDVATVHRFAHRIKGAAAAVGGERLSEISGAMEDSARARDRDAVAELLVPLQAEFIRLKAAIEHWLDLP